jgi:hypothetical protein
MSVLKSGKFPLPSSASLTDTSLTAVACPGVTSCTVIGLYTDTSETTQVLILTGSGALWTATDAPLPPNAGLAGGQISIACPSVSSRTAAGLDDNSSNHEEVLILTGSGKSWSAVGVPPPPGAIAQTLGPISAIGCTTASLCTAVGSYEDSSHSKDCW